MIKYKERFFDFEVTPNWWCVSFGDLPDDLNDLNEELKNNFVTIDSDMKNSRDLVIKMLREEYHVMFGYNIKGYDLVIANAIYQGFTAQQIFVISDLIINPDKCNSTKEHSRLFSFTKKKMRNVVYEDLLDDGTGTLKEKEAILGLDIMESTVPFDKEDLTEDDKKDIIKYNKHDVYASMIYYKEVVKPYSKVKLLMGQKFNIPIQTCYTSTNARLVSMALGAKRHSYNDEEKVEIKLPNKIQKYCNDNMPLECINKIENSVKGFKTTLFGNKVVFGNGGVHSTPVTIDSDLNEGLYVESDEEYVLLIIDATSYYPSEMIQFNLLSRSVENPQVFIDIFNERISIKYKQNKTKDDEDANLADKLVLNTTFGASGNKWLDLYDPYMCTSVCRVGQIFLTSLACKLYSYVKGLKIIQLNTDGILCYVKRCYLNLVRECIKEWTNVSGIQMEEDVVEKIWQLNVNNYLMVKEGGKIKSKGAWLNDSIYRPGYVTLSPQNANICARAATQFLINGKNPIKYILDCKNLEDFIIICTKGPTYKGVVQRMSDGTEIDLFKCNRVIASKDESLGKLYKWKNMKDKKSYSSMPSTPEHCRTMNCDLRTYDFNEVRKDLDYSFYVERLYNLLDVNWKMYCGEDLIETHQFDFMG